MQQDTAFDVDAAEQRSGPANPAAVARDSVTFLQNPADVMVAYLTADDEELNAEIE